MLDKDIIQSTSSWPFVEIRRLLKDRRELIKAKNKITFQTGYGPSGLPHIGTFGEVARTTMMINALNHIEKIETALEPKFQDYFVDAMAFPNKTDPFPNLFSVVTRPEGKIVTDNGSGRKRRRR